MILFLQNLQDEMMDLMDVSNEIQETLGRSYSVPDDIDEEELMGGKICSPGFIPKQERRNENCFFFSLFSFLSVPLWVMICYFSMELIGLTIHFLCDF